MKHTALLTAAALLFLPVSAHAAVEHYTLDKPHTQIMFSVEHMGFSHSNGKFLGYEGHFDFDREHPEKSSAEAVIHTSTLELGDPLWNEHTGKFFHSDKFPDMTFKSTGVKLTGDKTADLTGNLTLLGVTRPVTLHVTFNKADRDPFGKYRSGFSATTEINRSDFGMKDGIPMVSDAVKIAIEVEAVRQDEPGQTQYNQ